MDATTLGSLLVGVGAVVGGVVAFVGKRGENAITGYSSLTQDLQEERDALRLQLTESHSLRAADQAELIRLRALVIQLGGTP
ncbi:hypothetical protein FCH28_09805 [Streptomyces piniterrae]|uniref:Uncharacterized protein n=1 Tax=Streptomyces piniterrae TaxID=2571125 RepID=A0A4U0NMY6_9ACTN|nr:hypothetical protein [Streptomyces piniterrae]TJZ55623.1 hypothetical protein FCH28_09805 [Streptomyces piniterrae]